MHYIGLIILLIIVIITILYFIKISSDNNDLIIEKFIEKYNTQTIQKVSADYLNTNGNPPVIHNSSSDTHKYVRSPTMNDHKTSTATFRPCQIHFNDDGTSKYVYEDGWQEFNTLTSQEDNSVYNVPYKKFANDNNNVREFENFNETTKCFKQKNIRINLNTYKYKSNDLIKYKPDSYVAVQYKNDKDVVSTDYFMQMFFDKQSGDTSLNKYKEDSINSICSYNYKRDLSLGNINNLYRLTIVPVSNNQNIPIDPNSIKDGIITSIDSVTIANEDNSEFRIHDKQFTESKFSELLVGRNISYYTITNGNILYRIDKQQASGTDLEGLLVNIYKFNRNLNCSDQVIKSYEIVEARLKSHLIINAESYISPSINPQNLFPADEIISNPNNYIPNNRIEEILSHEINGISKDILIKVLNATNKNTYNTKDELLEYIFYFILKIIVISNRNLITQIIDLMNLNKQNSERKHEFIRSFDTFQKFMKLYRDNQGDNLKKEILEDIRKKKNIEFDQIYMHKFKSIALLPSNEIIPFTLENINDKVSNLYIYNVDTANKTFTAPQNINCDILIVAGGGAGGRNRFPSGRAGGGGGAGGLIYLQNQNISAGSYNITVGNGGNIDEGGNNSGEGFNGGNSSFGTFIAIGGGGGGTTFQDKHDSTGRNGGSGGGAGAGAGEHHVPTYRNPTGDGIDGGKGVAGQGFGGGNNWARSDHGGAGAGGGGADGGGALWKNVNWSYAPGRGGSGRSISITGTPIIYAKGGDGGWWDGSNTPKSGLPNTGGGGDGTGWKPAGKGGSGVVIIKINTELKRSGYDSIQKVENTKRKFTIYSNELKINDLSSKIIMKERDVELTINNSTIVTLKKNTTYIIDRANSQEIRIREKIKSEEIVIEKDFIYTNPGNHTFRVPENVTNICILCIGGGGGGNTYTNDGGGGGGGGLIWVNNLNVTPNQDFNIIVGAGGTPGNNGGFSSFSNSSIRIDAYGGNSSGNTSIGGTGGSFGLTYSKNLDAGGGYGGNGGSGTITFNPPNQYLYDYLAGGGGGAGGYTGKGGNGSVGDYFNANGGKLGENGSGGGGGGGGRGNTLGAGGGGVGIYGIGSNGNGNRNSADNIATGGGGGSGGADGQGLNGGVYGGGGGGGDDNNGGSGGNGAVRIICTQSKTFPSNAGATQGSIIIPGVYNNIATFNTTSIELSYDVNDIDLLNFNNVKNNMEIDDNQVQRIIGRKAQSNSSILYEYKIGTKTKDEYLKVGIMIRTLYSDAMEQQEKSEPIFNIINPNGKGELNFSVDFEVNQHNIQNNDVITIGLVIIFKNTFSGDIFLKLWLKSFIYDFTIDPNKEIIQEVESDFINGRNNNNSLVSIISAYEWRINSYFNLNTYDNDSKQIYNLSTYYSINREDGTLKIGGLTDARRDILTKLQNIYNSVLIFKASESSRKPKISFVNNKKVKDIIDGININNISYENPINKQAESYNKLNYHLQPISNNYVYFKYPL
jgi:hypothetical protein